MQSLVLVFKKHIMYVFMYTCMICMYTSVTASVWRSEDSSTELVLYFHFYTVPRTQVRSSSLCGKQLYPLSYSGDSLTAEVSKLPLIYSDENS